MADPNSGRGAPPREVHIEKKRTNRLAWAALILGVLAVLLALARCNHRNEVVAPAPPPTTVQAAPVTPAIAVKHVVLPGGRTVDLQPQTLTYDLQAFLASQSPTPRTFTFEKLNFNTGSSQVRADDQPTLNALTSILGAYPAAKVKLVGYADARGSEPANQQLGADRAAAIAHALINAGIASDRITTGSGSDSNPVASNATASGQAENRRTELTVVAK